MPIRASHSREVRQLVAVLMDADPGAEAARETARARLAIIGPRAVRQLLDALKSCGTDEARAAILSALERVPDARAIGPVLVAAKASALDVRLAALGAARSLVELDPKNSPLLDALTALVLDAAEPGQVRVRALEAIAGLPTRTLRPLLDRLRADADPSVRDFLRADGRVRVDADPLEELEAASRGDLPCDAEALLRMVGRAGAAAPLSTLHRLVERVRARDAGRRPGRRAREREWLAARGALHVLLAERGSRVALYDLREAFGTFDDHPLPPAFVEALRRQGDASFLDVVFGAWRHAQGMRGGETAAWKSRLKAAFHEVLERERPASRQKALEKLRQRARSREDAAALAGLLG